MNDSASMTDEVWTDPRMVADPRIDDGDRDVHRVTEALPRTEPRHLHDAHTMGPVCIFCARRATLAVRAVHDAHRHDGWDRHGGPGGRR